MFNKLTLAVCVAFVLAAPLSGCYLASNGLDYSNQAIVKAPSPAAAPQCGTTATGVC